MLIEIIQAHTGLLRLTALLPTLQAVVTDPLEEWEEQLEAVEAVAVEAVVYFVLCPDLTKPKAAGLSLLLNGLSFGLGLLIT